MNDRSEKAVKGAAASAVTPEEVKRLILAAQAAWREQTRIGLAEEDFDAWRHGALYDAVRKTSFRQVTQREFGLALGHFGRLAGRGPNTSWQRANEAIASRESTPEGDRRRAEHVLRETCAGLDEAFGGPDKALAYACVLLRRIHRTDLPAATAKQIWQVMFTMKARGKAHAAKQAAMEAERPAPAVCG